MGKYQGVKEKLHFPIYDAFFVEEGRDKTFEKAMTDPRMIRFFVDVQNKTKLETNLQSSGVLPSQNTLEVRAMRVVVSPASAMIETQELTEIAKRYCSGSADKDNVLRKEIHQVFEHTYAKMSLILSVLVYSSVTTLLVGEKIMIEAPTWYFPSGAGVHPGSGIIANHGEPDPMATFRFAEPVIIEPHQNFRVEMLFPRGVPDPLKTQSGPFTIWVVLDGYLVRDVQ